MLNERKRKDLIRAYIKNDLDGEFFELWREPETMDNEGYAHAFQAIPSPIIGTGIFILEETEDEAIEMFKKHYPDRWEMAEVEKYKNYTIIYD